MRGYSKRRQEKRRPYDVFLLVCEGKKTERTYFNRFRTRGNNLRILTPDTKSTDPQNLVEFAIVQKNVLGLDVDSGDRAWCLFDVDENSKKGIQKAVEKAEANGIVAIVSNPCFEVWFLLHHTECNASLTSREIMEQLKSFIPDYEKSYDVFDLLTCNQHLAIQRARKLMDSHIKEGLKEFDVESNPSTNVHSVVTSILNHKKK